MRNPVQAKARLTALLEERKIKDGIVISTANEILKQMEGKTPGQYRKARQMARGNVAKLHNLPQNFTSDEAKGIFDKQARAFTRGTDLARAALGLTHQ